MVWISWPGSKKHEAKKVFKDVDFKNYDIVADVFGGAGWLGLYVAKNNKEIKVIYNDTSEYLHKLFDYLNTEEFSNELEIFKKKFPNIKELITEAKKSSKTVKELCEKLREGMSDSFVQWMFSKISRCVTEKEGNIKNPSILSNSNIELDKTILQTFNSFERYKMDYKDFIEYINKQFNGKRVLFIFDPPYFCTSKIYKTNYFNVDEYIKMINIINKLEHFVFVSYESDFLKYIIKHEMCNETIKEDSYSTAQASISLKEGTSKKTILRIF